MLKKKEAAQMLRKFLGKEAATITPSEIADMIAVAKEEEKEWAEFIEVLEHMKEGKQNGSLCQKCGKPYGALHPSSECEKK